MTLGDRIKFIRKNENLTQEEFAEKVFETRDAINNLERDRLAKPDRKAPTLVVISQKFSVDYIWLTTGKGEPYTKFDDEFDAKLELIMAGENNFHKKLIKMIANLSEDEIDKIQAKLSMLLEEENKEAD